MKQRSGGRDLRNMSKELSGKRVAILVTDGFEQIEMTAPQKMIEEFSHQQVSA